MAEPNVNLPPQRSQSLRLSVAGKVRAADRKRVLAAQAACSRLFSAEDLSLRCGGRELDDSARLSGNHLVLDLYWKSASTARLSEHSSCASEGSADPPRAPHAAAQAAAARGRRRDATGRRYLPRQERQERKTCGPTAEAVLDNVAHGTAATSVAACGNARPALEPGGSCSPAARSEQERLGDVSGSGKSGRQSESQRPNPYGRGVEVFMLSDTAGAEVQVDDVWNMDWAALPLRVTGLADDAGHDSDAESASDEGAQGFDAEVSNAGNVQGPGTVNRDSVSVRDLGFVPNRAAEDCALDPLASYTTARQYVRVGDPVLVHSLTGGDQCPCRDGEVIAITLAGTSGKDRIMVEYWVGDVVHSKNLNRLSATWRPQPPTPMAEGAISPTATAGDAQGSPSPVRRRQVRVGDVVGIHSVTAGDKWVEAKVIAIGGLSGGDLRLEYWPDADSKCSKNLDLFSPNWCPRAPRQVPAGVGVAKGSVAAVAAASLRRVQFGGA